MDVTLTEALTVYGPLGLWAGAATYAAVKLFRELRAAEDRHRIEMRALIDREIERSKTIVEQFHSVVDKLREVFDRLERRVRRD